MDYKWVTNIEISVKIIKDIAYRKTYCFCFYIKDRNIGRKNEKYLIIENFYLEISDIGIFIKIEIGKNWKI